MDLKIVTFTGDSTQFLVDDPDNNGAIASAMRANTSSALGMCDTEMEKLVKDPGNYTVKNVSDIYDLYDVFRQREDAVMLYGVIAFRE